MSAGAAIDNSDLARLRVLMAGIKNGYERAMSRAVNKSLTGARTDFVNETRQILNLKAKFVRDTAKMNRATFKKLQGSLQAKSDSIPLIQFAGRQVKAGVTVSVLKGQPRTLIRHAFIATMKSGHQGIFWREQKHPGVNVISKPRPEFGRLPDTEKAKKYRLPIKELFGPSIEAVFDVRPARMDNLMYLAMERLQKNFEHEVDFELKRLGLR